MDSLDSPIDRPGFTPLVPAQGDSQTVTGDLSLPTDGSTTSERFCSVAARDCWLIVSLSQGTTLIEPVTVLDGRHLRQLGCHSNMVVPKHVK